MNTARKGARLEHRSRSLLERAGFAVMRAAGSKGAFDLAGFSATGIVLVQCKAGRWPPPEELDALRAFPVPPGVRKEVHRWPPRAAVPDVRPVGAEV